MTTTCLLLAPMGLMGQTHAKGKKGQGSAKVESPLDKLGIALLEGKVFSDQAETNDLKSQMAGGHRIHCQIRAETFSEAVVQWVRENQLASKLGKIGLVPCTSDEMRYLMKTRRNFPNPMGGEELRVVLRPRAAADMRELCEGIQLISNRSEGRSSAMVNVLLVTLTADGYAYDGGVSSFDLCIRSMPYGLLALDDRPKNVCVIDSMNIDSTAIVKKVSDAISVRQSVAP